MSVAKLSRRCLRAMRKAYRSSSQTAFDMPFFLNACHGFSEIDLSMALYRLKTNGIVSILAADGIAYMVSYRPDMDESHRNGMFASALKQLIDFIKP